PTDLVHARSADRRLHARVNYPWLEPVREHACVRQLEMHGSRQHRQRSLRRAVGTPALQGRVSGPGADVDDDTFSLRHQVRHHRLITWKAPMTFTSNARRQAAGSASPIIAIGSITPALSTRMSIRPRLDVVDSTSALTSSTLATSHAKAVALPPASAISSATARPASK